MSIIDLLVSPGAFVGCLVGIGVGAALHWLFPSEDLVAVQAILIVFFCIGGLAVEHHATDKARKK